MQELAAILGQGVRGNRERDRKLGKECCEWVVVDGAPKRDHSEEEWVACSQVTLRHNPSNYTFYIRSTRCLGERGSSELWLLYAHELHVGSVRPTGIVEPSCLEHQDDFSSEREKGIRSLDEG